MSKDSDATLSDDGMLPIRTNGGIGHLCRRVRVIDVLICERYDVAGEVSVGAVMDASLNEQASTTS